MTQAEAIATLALLAQQRVNRLGDRVEACYRDQSFSRAFPEKARYERAMTRLGVAREALNI